MQSDLDSLRQEKRVPASSTQSTQISNAQQRWSEVKMVACTEALEEALSVHKEAGIKVDWRINLLIPFGMVDILALY